MGLEVYIIWGGRNVLLKKYKTTKTEPDTKVNIYVCVKLTELYSKKAYVGTSLEIQWLGMCLAIQGVQVRSGS